MGPSVAACRRCLCATPTTRRSYVRVAPDASKDIPCRDLPGARRLTLTPLAVQRAERLVCSELEKVEGIVVGHVEDVHWGLHAARAESNVLADSQVPDVHRWQRGLTLVSRLVRKACGRRKRIRDDATVGKSHRRGPETRIRRSQTREDWAGPQSRLKRVVGGQDDVPPAAI